MFINEIPRRMPRYLCKVCGKEKPLSSALGICKECILKRFDEAKEFIDLAHFKARSIFNLPLHPPKANGGKKCIICSNECIMQDGDISYCGLRLVKDNRYIQYATSDKALTYVYLDPHVTNCSLSWTCPGGTGKGYPRFAVKPGPEKGYYNLAVFFYGCNFSCLYCQNWEHKKFKEGQIITAKHLAEMAINNKRITCICYFGGSPEPHLPFTIRTNELILKMKEENRILRMCYEWNGTGNKYLVRRAAEQVLLSGGIIKFDLKAPNSKLNYALSGVPNERVFENFQMVYEDFWNERPEVPILGATTLLVPGYIGPEDIEEIAKFIASLNPDIPYSLLVFYPQFMMKDLPITPRKIVYDSLRIARKYLNNVNVGNTHLLSLAPETL